MAESQTTTGNPAAGTRDNTMGTDGFKFVEYTAPDPELLCTLFERMGFPITARHRGKNVTCTLNATSTSSSMRSATASHRNLVSSIRDRVRIEMLDAEGARPRVVKFGR